MKPGEESSAQSNGRKGRRATILAIASLLILFAAGGYVAAEAFQSPAQREASAAAPAKKPITATVRQGDLAKVVTAEVETSRSSVQEVTLGDGTGVVSGHPITQNSSFSAGDQFTEVNGRPLFVMPGSFSFYRDMHFGDDGPDVKQLQAGLVAAGFSNSVDGKFGAQTETALKALYTSQGYQVPQDDAGTTVDESAASDPSKETQSSPSDGAQDALDGEAKDSSTEDQATAAGSVGQPETPKHAYAATNDFVVVRETPAVSQAALAIGTPVTSELKLPIASGSTVLVGSFPSSTASYMSVGDKISVQMTSEQLEDVAVLEVSKPDDDGNVTIKFAGDALQGSGTGAKGIATVRLSSVADNALLVPTVAIVTEGGTTNGVVLVERSGAFERVEVAELGNLDGVSAVKPLDGAKLHTGDRIKVG